MPACYTIQINLFLSEVSDLLPNTIWKTWLFNPISDLHLSSKYTQVGDVASSPDW